MLSNLRSLRVALLLIVILAAAPIVYPQATVLWEPVGISTRNLYLGPGGAALRPNLRRITFIQKETGGNNPKYRIKDGSGRIWVAKVADESQPEVASNRLLWALGYKTEIDYLVPRLRIPRVGTVRNARLEARPANVDRQDRWSWTENPFVGTNELQGLKIMMALFNNWDMKEGNNIILATGGERHYVVSDLGAAFGKLSPTSLPILTRFGRSVNRPDHFVKSKFIDGFTKEGEIDFAYKGKGAGLLKDVTREHARWTADLLLRLSDKQIGDAFRAANYTPSQVRLLTRAVRSRINALNRSAGQDMEAVR